MAETNQIITDKLKKEVQESKKEVRRLTNILANGVPNSTMLQGSLPPSLVSENYLPMFSNSHTVYLA